MQKIQDGYFMKVSTRQSNTTNKMSNTAKENKTSPQCTKITCHVDYAQAGKMKHRST